MDESYAKFAPTLKTLRVSVSDGPVYTICPEAELYVREPNPPASVTVIAARPRESV